MFIRKYSKIYHIVLWMIVLQINVIFAPIINELKQSGYSL